MLKVTREHFSREEKKSAPIFMLYISLVPNFISISQRLCLMHYSQCAYAVPILSLSLFLIPSGSSVALQPFGNSAFFSHFFFLLNVNIQAMSHFRHYLVKS